MKQIGGIIDINDYEYVVKRFGEPLIGIPAPTSRKKINPHVSKFITKDGYTIRVFHVKPVYYYSIQNEWRPLYEVASYFGNKKGMVLRGDWENHVHYGYLAWYLKRQELLGGNGVLLEYPISYHEKQIDRILRPLYMNPSPYFPDPDPETTSVDGWVRRSGVDEVFSTIRGGAGTLSADSTTPVDTITLAATAITDQWSQLWRVITMFDTSDIADTDTVDTGTASFEINSIRDANNMNPEINLALYTGTSTTSIVNADYNIANWTMTLQSDTQTLLGSLTLNAYNDFTLNATGRGNVSKTGLTKFGWIRGSDLDNVAETWGNGIFSDANFDFAETAGTGSDPKLAITSSAAADDITLLRLMGIGM